MTIKNPQLRRELSKRGLGSVNLEKSEGYFYIWSDDETCDGVYDTSFCIYSFNECSPKEWAEMIENRIRNNK